MVKILSDAIYDDFMKSVEEAKENIMLCAPFIKNDIIEDIYTYKKSAANITVITNVKLMSFYRKALDCKGLSKVLEERGDVFNYPMLHAKFYIFDNRKLIITSANLTTSGLRRNKEYGILTDDISLISTAINDFEMLCNEDITGRVKKDHLIEIQDIIDSVPKEKKIHLPKYVIEQNENDEEFPENILNITTKLTGWKKDVFNVIFNYPNQSFSTKEFSEFVPGLKGLHPENNNIEAKIRQVLQQLRDIGVIKFEGGGQYKKLWKS
jgi:HKD family nuclease